MINLTNPIHGKGSRKPIAFETNLRYCIPMADWFLVRLLKNLEVITNNFGMSYICLIPLSYIYMRC